MRAEAGCAMVMPRPECGNVDLDPDRATQASAGRLGGGVLVCISFQQLNPPLTGALPRMLWPVKVRPAGAYRSEAPTTQ